jgi:hypothetical protein
MIDSKSLGQEADKIIKRGECRDCGNIWWFDLSNCYVCIECRKTHGKDSHTPAPMNLPTNPPKDLKTIRDELKEEWREQYTRPIFANGYVEAYEYGFTAATDVVFDRIVEALKRTSRMDAVDYLIENKDRILK